MVSMHQNDRGLKTKQLKLIKRRLRLVKSACVAVHRLKKWPWPALACQPWVLLTRSLNCLASPFFAPFFFFIAGRQCQTFQSSFCSLMRSSYRLHLRPERFLVSLSTSDEELALWIAPSIVSNPGERRVEWSHSDSLYQCQWKKQEKRRSSDQAPQPWNN